MLFGFLFKREGGVCRRQGENSLLVLVGGEIQASRMPETILFILAIYIYIVKREK